MSSIAPPVQRSSAADSVTSSAARYHYLLGMTEFGREVRLNHLNYVRQRCPPDVQRRVEEIEAYSQEMWEHFYDTQEVEKKTAYNQWQK